MLFLKNKKIQINMKARKATDFSVSTKCFVRLWEISSGIWEVCDQTGDRGGRFRDRHSAKTFIRHEFAGQQPTIIEEI